MSNSGDLGEQRTIEFFAQYGLTCVRYSKAELRAGKTPDLKVYKGSEFVLYAESKLIEEDLWLDDQLKSAPPGTLVGGLRNDPIPNRIAADIYTAAKQFSAVNPNHEYPNVLVLTNADNQCNIADLRAVIDGDVVFDSGLVEPMFKHVSEGRIKVPKQKIDLYIWCNEIPGAKFKYQLRFMRGSKFLNQLCSLFDVDPEQIKRSR
jgi:hypothetical protein